MKPQAPIISAFFLCGLVLLFLPIKAPLNIYDEGLALLNATRAMNGEVPYGDFWTIYAPGQFYTLAAVFQLFDANVLVARIYDSLVRFGLTIGIYLISLRLTSYKVALIPWAIAVLWLSSATFYTYPVFPALLLGLLALLTLYKFAATEQRRWLLSAGLCVGFSAVFRLDIGAYAGLSAALFLLFYGLIGPITEPAPQFRERIQTTVQAGLLLFLGFALIALPIYLYLMIVSGFDRVWAQLVVFPLTIFPEVRRLPYPDLLPDLSILLPGIFATGPGQPGFLHWLRFYRPSLTFALTACVAGITLLRSRKVQNPDTTPIYQAMSLVAFGGLLFAQALSRYDWIHALPTSLLALILLTWLLYTVPNSYWRRFEFSIPCIGILAVVTAAYTLPFINNLSRTVEAFPVDGCYSEVERANCVFINPQQERAVQYLQALTSEDEPIYVGNRRHDLILINDISFYFLADRPVATRYHELHPGVATTQAVQEAIVDGLRARDVRWLVVVDIPDSVEPNASSISSGVTILDDFIQAQYQPEVRLETYRIWRRIEAR